MKINKINIKGGNVNFSEKLKITNSENSGETDLIRILLELSQEQLAVLEDLQNEISTKPSSIMKKLNKFIEQHILPIGYSMSASALFELLKKM